MSGYVDKIEDLLNLHPMAKAGLIDHPIECNAKKDTG